MDDKYIAIVLCAGFGSRLKPITDYIPKVVCPLVDKPFAFYSIEKLFQSGFQTVHCNVHYLSQIVMEELTQACIYFGYDPKRIRFWKEEEILQTGGGIARIYHELCSENKENLSKDLVAVSGDIVSYFPLNEMTSLWKNRSTKVQALMCTRDMLQAREDATYINSKENMVLGFGKKFERKDLAIAKVFTNHQIISGQVVQNCGVEKVSSIQLFYEKILTQGMEILNFNYTQDMPWYNIGTIDEYLECIDDIASDKWKLGKYQISENFKGYQGLEKINLVYQFPDKLNLNSINKNTLQIQERR